MGKSILICDDHSLVLQTLEEFIHARSPELNVIATEDREHAVNLLETDSSIDLAIFDLRMPGITDLSSLKDLIDNSQKIPVAIMSGFANQSEVRQLMQWGAAGFIPKTVSGMGLVNAINLMLCGETYVPSSLLDNTNEDSLNELEITPRELDVLRYLHLGYSNKEIARQFEVEEITVKVYVSRLCKKLNAKNRTQVVVRALSNGIIG